MSPNDLPNARRFDVPIILTNFKMAGFAAESKPAGAPKIAVSQYATMTSDHPWFHRIVRNLSGFHSVSSEVDLTRHNWILIIIRDTEAKLYIDDITVEIKAMSKRDFRPGELVFENDLADIMELNLPNIEFLESDQVLFLFREGWRFGLHYDLNRAQPFSIAKFNRTVGGLYRGLRYASIYDAMSDASLVKKLMEAGWFPFAEIVTTEFQELIEHCTHGFGLQELDSQIISRFDSKRLNRMLERWLRHPHLKAREGLLRSAVRNFEANDPHAVIKIILTELEGILNDSHRAKHSVGAKAKALIEFATEMAKLKSGSADTLLFPTQFQIYMAERIFAQFDPKSGKGLAHSRHAVGHGAADSNSYTQTGALQALLTLDQIVFFS